MYIKCKLKRKDRVPVDQALGLSREADSGQLVIPGVYPVAQKGTELLVIKECSEVRIQPEYYVLHARGRVVSENTLTIAGHTGLHGFVKGYVLGEDVRHYSFFWLYNIFIKVMIRMVDRHMQLILLKSLRDNFPAFISLEGFFHNVLCSVLPDDFDDSDEEERCQQSFLFNLDYLVGHKLVARPAPVHLKRYDHTEIPRAYRITSKGIDFLEDDGGLSAILNIVTVKFDADNIRGLVKAGLLKANVPEEKQGALKKAIQEAPGTVLQTAVSTIVGQGMSSPVETAKIVAKLFGVTW